MRVSTLAAGWPNVYRKADKVVVRGTDRFTHLGEFMGYPPTGKQATITWIDIFRIENGKAIGAWLEIDSQRLRDQLLPDPVLRPAGQ